MEQEKNTYSTFDEASKLLVKLQQQLLDYKSALEKLDEVANASESVSTAAGTIAQTAEKIGPIITKLDESQEALKKSLEFTYKTLAYTQKKSKELQDGFEAMSQKFSDNMEHEIQNRAADLNKKLERSFLSGESGIGKEVKTMRMLAIGNSVMSGLLLLGLLFLIFSRAPAGGASNNDLVAVDDPLGPAPIQTSSPIGSDTDYRSGAQGTSNPIVGPLQVQILNGCGIDGVASRFKSFLDRNGFSVEDTRNADNFNYRNTVIYAHARSITQARQIATLLEIDIDRVTQTISETGEYDIIITLGRDYRLLSPSRN